MPKDKTGCTRVKRRTCCCETKTLLTIKEQKTTSNDHCRGEDKISWYFVNWQNTDRNCMLKCNYNLKMSWRNHHHHHQLRQRQTVILLLLLVLYGTGCFRNSSSTYHPDIFSYTLSNMCMFEWSIYLNILFRLSVEMKKWSTKKVKTLNLIVVYTVAWLLFWWMSISLYRMILMADIIVEV